MILIVTIEQDLHALAVQRALQQRGYRDCQILECDRISDRYRLRAELSAMARRAAVTCPGGITIDLAGVSTIWWRRVRADQKLDVPATDEQHAKLINNDCRGALNGLLAASFAGLWISSPEATDRASDKVHQLTVAMAQGFRIPDTLISQSRTDVEDFCRRHDGRVIVKPIVGASGPILPTQLIGDLSRLDPHSFEVSPAIYQEYIPGRQHVRLNCFGDQSFAAVIETDELDWRPNLNVPIRPWPVPDWLHARVRSTLDALDLRMGILDLKVMPDGEIVWLEVNPQGQFLFLEGITGMPLSEYFADYLLSTTPSI
jgi:glutathione synthase/RimK-type ligase-like ATP-grasp enzyme